ncbi:MAG TPA: MFS transporter [Gaiellaceae bacterium]|nr:MFS transporter [Gaiellaceae bacterium]
MRSLLARTDVRLLLAGQSLSMFGDWAMFIVLAVWVKVLTGSSSAAGLVFFVLTLASLAAPFGGLVVDRLPKRPLMIATHLALAAVMCLLLLVHDRGDIWLLYLVTALYGLGGDLFGAARSAMLKAMLPDEQLVEANGALQSVREGLRIVAPLAGAGLYAAFGGGVVALVDAGSFVASAATLAVLPFVEPPPAPKEHHFLREISAGVTHVWRTRLLRELTIGVGAALLVVGFSETLIFAVNSQSLHRSPAFIGVLSAFQGIGSIAGGLTVAMLMRRLGDLRLTGLGLFVFALGDGMLLVPRLAPIAVGAAVAGLGIVWAIVALATAYQKWSPLPLQGRVSAAANMLFSVPQTISIALGALLVTLIDYRIEIAIMTAATICAAVYLLTRKPAETEEVEIALAA